jgi:hypothetical protein
MREEKQPPHIASWQNYREEIRKKIGTIYVED